MPLETQTPAYLNDITVMQDSGFSVFPFSEYFSELRTLFGDMEQLEFAEFAGGVATGAVVEAAAKMDSPHVCLRQAADVSQAAVLVYYYYNEYKNPPQG